LEIFSFDIDDNKQRKKLHLQAIWARSCLPLASGS